MGPWGKNTNAFNDFQVNHIYSDSQNEEIYTSLANLCATPSFLAKLTDTDDKIKSHLEYRSWELYKFNPKNTQMKEPENYSSKCWKEPLKEIDDIYTVFTERIDKNPKSHAAISKSKLGWFFSQHSTESKSKKII